MAVPEGALTMFATGRVALTSPVHSGKVECSLPSRKQPLSPSRVLTSPRSPASRAGCEIPRSLTVAGAPCALGRMPRASLMPITPGAVVASTPAASGGLSGGGA